VIVGWFDPSGRVAAVGLAVTRVLGWPPGALLRGTGVELVHLGDRLAVQDRLVAAAGAGPGPPGSPSARGRTELRVRHRDGGWRWLEVHAVPFELPPPAQGPSWVNLRAVDHATRGPVV